MSVWDAAGHLVRIGHCPGHVVKIEKKHGEKIDHNYPAKDNFNDVIACFVMQAMP